MKIYINLVFLLVFCFVLQSGIIKNCTKINIEIESLEKIYDCKNVKRNLFIDIPNNSFIVIKNKKDFIAITDKDYYSIKGLNKSNSCKPNIDFDKFDLILGRTRTTSGSTYLKYNLSKECEIFTLKVTKYLPNSGRGISTTDAPLYTFHALIPKLKNTQKLTVEIHTN